MTYIPRVDATIQHCLRTYGGTIYLKNNVLHIKIGPDYFHVNITDGAKFNRFYLYHRNHQRSLDGKFYYHRQLYCKYLDYAVYAAFTHHFMKALGLHSTQEDWSRFRGDAKKYYDPDCKLNTLGSVFFY